MAPETPEGQRSVYLGFSGKATEELSGAGFRGAMSEKPDCSGLRCGWELRNRGGSVDKDFQGEREKEKRDNASGRGADREPQAGPLLSAEPDTG